MRSTIIFILGTSTFLLAYAILVWLVMLVLGGIGSWLDIPVYEYIGFWETAGIGVIFSLFGFLTR